MIESIDIVGAPPTSGGSPSPAVPGVFAGGLQEAVAAATPAAVAVPGVDVEPAALAAAALAGDAVAVDPAAIETPTASSVEEPRITAPPGGCSCCLGIAVAAVPEQPSLVISPPGVPAAVPADAVADAVGAGLGDGAIEVVADDTGTTGARPIERDEGTTDTEATVGDPTEGRPDETTDATGATAIVPGTIVAGAAAGAPRPPAPGASSATSPAPASVGLTAVTGAPSGGDTTAAEDDSPSPGSPGSPGDPIGAPDDRAIGIDQRVGAPTEPSATAGSGSSGQPSVERPGSTANAGVMRSDQVRVLREMAPNRELQRLAIDLDGARVSVRVDHDVAKVQVLSDPGQRLSGTWADDVQRTLNATLRQDTGAQTPPDGGRRNRNPYQQATTDQTADSEFSGRLDLARGV